MPRIAGKPATRVAHAPAPSAAPTPDPASPSPVDGPAAPPPAPSRRPPLGKKAPPVKPLAGTVQIHGGWYTVRVRRGGQRPRFKLGKVGEMSEARAHEAAAALCERLARDDAGPAPTTPRAPTFQDIGERWTSGELARRHPDHVKVKGTAEADRRRLESYVYPHVRGVPIVDFTLEHAERIMRLLPAKRVRTAATRRHVAQIIHRVLALAVFPLRILKVHPLPPGFRPKIGPPKAKGYLYPDEDAALLKCAAVPLCWRVLYGFLSREGCRVSEATALELAAADLRRGVVVLDENKTDDPRAWALGLDVTRALRAWVAHREASAGAPLPRSAPLFIDEEGKPIGEASLAAQLREHLQAAGVDRAALYQHNENRLRMRAHDLRATFVTLALANGRTETWVADRTGHKSSEMINGYRRASRTAAELGLGWLTPLDVAIPELGGAAGETSEGGAGEADGAPNGGGEGAPDGPEGRTQAWTHAGLDVAKRGGEDAGSSAESDVSPRFGAVFESPNRGSNPCTGTEDSAIGPVLGSKVGSMSPERTAAPPSNVAPEATTSIRADMARALADGLARALAAGDARAARVALAALSGLVGDDAEGPAAPVVDLGAERRRRER